MPAEVIQANYETLEEISSNFTSLQSMAEAVNNSISSYARQLCPEGFEGEAADKFMAEMEADILPSMQRLCAALTSASQSIKRVSSIIHDAEEEASCHFK